MTKKVFSFFAFVVLFMACTKTDTMKLFPVSNFEKKVDGKDVSLYTLRNENGIVTQITNYGARIVNLWVPNKDKKPTDVVLGLTNIDEYLDHGEYLGAIVGRYANRIAAGKFILNNKEYSLATNNNGNHLHGGKKGFADVVWDATPFTNDKKEEGVSLTYVSQDGEEGYPGEVTIQVNYTLTKDNSLKIDYKATCKDSTVLNITNHAFFNLLGEGNGEINSHVAMINADNYTPTDEGLIPTGEIAPVKGTPMDFTTPTVIGKRLQEDFKDLKYGKGYDHNWVLNKTKEGELSLAAEIYEPSNGIKMTMFTTEPAMQFYGGNFLNGSVIGAHGKAFDYRTAFCFEAQHYPDSPNHANFPSTILVPGETYTQTTIYKFDIQK